MIMDSGAEDIVYTAAVSGVNANFLRPSLEAMGITEERWSENKKIDFWNRIGCNKRRSKSLENHLVCRSRGYQPLMIMSISDLIGKLKSEFLDAMRSQQELLKHKYPSLKVCA